MKKSMRSPSLAALAAFILSVPACAQTCTGDIVQDGRVDGGDLGTLLANWGPVTTTTVSRACDLNGDGRVDGADLGMALVNWGACPTIVPAWATLLEPYPSSAVVADPALRAAISASGLAPLSRTKVMTQPTAPRLTSTASRAKRTISRAAR